MFVAGLLPTACYGIRLGAQQLMKNPLKTGLKRWGGGEVNKE
jgi:hypothetical protein